MAVSANLVTVGICEQSGASCQGPASRNGIALVLPTKGVLAGHGGMGYEALNDRPGIHARTLGDAARVLDALMDPATGPYSRIDPFSAVPRALIHRAGLDRHTSQQAPTGGASPSPGPRVPSRSTPHQRRV